MSWQKYELKALTPVGVIRIKVRRTFPETELTIRNLFKKTIVLLVNLPFFVLQQNGKAFLSGRDNRFYSSLYYKLGDSIFEGPFPFME